MIPLIAIWQIEQGTINPAIIFKDNLSKKIELQMTKTRSRNSRKIQKQNSELDPSKKNLQTYLATKVENYDKFAAFLV